MKKLILAIFICVFLASCKKDTVNEEPTPEPTPTNNCPASTCIEPDTIFNLPGGGPYLIFKFKFDSTQARLNNLGMPSTIPSTNAAVSPKFNRMSAHYIEMAQTDLTPVGGGKVLYRAPETTCGGNNAITFCQSIVARDGQTFFAVPISSVTPGSYKWLRVSLAYQNYDIPYLSTSTGSVTQWGTIASFVGFNNYITKYKIKNVMATPSSSLGGPGNHLQGYWGFETQISSLTYTVDGQPPAGATTVVNPNPSSPIPAGSCLVTGEFFNTIGGLNMPLTITGTETSNIVITVSLSTNKSFEWKEVNFNGYYEPMAGEFPVDMGLRGMIPKY
jgi:hypothetical protein